MNQDLPKTEIILDQDVVQKHRQINSCIEILNLSNEVSDLDDSKLSNQMSAENPFNCNKVTHALVQSE